MKHFFYRIYFFLFVVLHFILNSEGYAQFGKIDTTTIQTIIDSCREVENSSEALDCHNNILLYIKQAYQTASNEKIKEFLNKAEVNALRTIGNTYRELSMYPKALEFYQKSLIKAEKTKNKRGVAAALLNSGNIYMDIAKDTTDKKNYGKALSYLQQSLKKFEEIDDKRGIAMSLNGIGNAYNNLSKWDTSLVYYIKSLKLQIELEDTLEISTCISNIAQANSLLKNYPQAMEYYEKGLRLSRQIHDEYGIVSSYLGIGEIFLKSGKLSDAEKYFISALSLAKKLESLSDESLAKKSLREVFEKQGRFKEALYMNDSAITAIDKINKLSQESEITKLEMQSDFDKKESAAKAEQEKKDAITAEEKRLQAIIIWSVATVLLLVAVFSIFMFNRWRVTQKQKKIIEVQKVEVEKSKKIIEEHNKDITDSIHYASRIQRALLTSDDYISKHLPEHFILFKPKDIVSGDFYWALSPFGNTSSKTFYIACCDCTGHGVPGAFMSLLNISFLNEALVEKHLRDTNSILNDVRASVIKALNPDGTTDAKDGMDAIICDIDLKSNILNASCANNPIWIVQNGEINEITPDKMPVGSFSKMESFTKHTVQLQKGDIVYAFTDGYADQFGGPK